MLMRMRKSIVVLLALSLLLCGLYAPEGSDAAGVSGTDIVGTVVNETGAPFPGVEVRATNFTKPGTVFKAISDGSGNYSMPSNFVPGLYNVTAVYTNYSANVSYTAIAVPLGGVVRLNFTLSEVLCTLTGFITNGTTPIYGATVTMIGAGVNYTATTLEPFGKYTISNVRPGSYNVVATKVGYFPSDVGPPQVMVRGVTNNLDFVLREQEARALGGKVVYDGNGLSGVKVVLTSSNSIYSFETETDADGNYSFQQVPVGSYSIVFSKERFQDSRFNLALSLNETRRLDVRLEFDVENNTQTFLLGLDLAHSLMVVGLVLSLVVLIVGLYLNNRIRRKPELLDRDDGSEK